MQLPIRSFSRCLRDMAVATQGAATQALDLSVGSVLRALHEANAAVAIWLQALVSDVMDASRAATARGDALDAWMADFGFERLSAVPAVGLVTFSRLVAAGTVSVPVGTRVRTTDGSLTFRLVRDTDHPRWDDGWAAYLIPDGIETLTVPVRCETPGSAGNVQAGSVTLMSTSVAGVDAVVNAAPMSGGLDAEADEAYRMRFRAHINSLSRATPTAVATAVAGVRQGLSFVIHENVDSAGAPRPGHFVVTVDDGSGDPPSDLLGAVATAIEAVRPVGTQFAVHPPSVITANVSLAVTLEGISPTAANQVRDRVASAIARHTNALRIGAVLSISRIAQVAYAADDAVANVTTIRINGADSDLSPGVRGVIKSGMIAVA